MDREADMRRMGVLMCLTGAIAIAAGAFLPALMDGSPLWPHWRREWGFIMERQGLTKRGWDLPFDRAVNYAGVCGGGGLLVTGLLLLRRRATS